MKLALSKKIEFFLLFIFTPTLLAIPFLPNWIKLSLVALAILFICFVSLKNRKLLFRKKAQLKPHQFWIKIVFNFILIFLVSFLYLKFTNSNLLFNPVLTKPFTWIKFLMIYTFISVLPQEYIYRVFFFYRYQNLVKHPKKFYLLNALVFSLAHLFFMNAFVLLFTFVGGYLFAYTYSKTKSWFWVSVEHALYGGWLFTLGLGKILGFPI